MADPTAGTLVAAAIVPGMPHLLAADAAPSWAQLGAAVRATGERIRAAGAEVVVMMSTQWFTVLGHQRPCGRVSHVASTPRSRSRCR